MPAAFRTLLAVLFLLPQLAFAQTYPSRSETPVTDDAELIGPVAEAELAQRLTTLSQDNGAEVAVVTLPTTALYTGGDDLDVYARGLMADWALGDTVGGRGILLLVFAEDRELRIEVGPGFGAEAQTAAAAIVQDTLVPAFRDDDFAGGIRDGVEAIGARMLNVAGTETPAEAAPAPEAAPAEAAPAPEAAPVAAAPEEVPAGSNRLLYWIGAGAAAVVALIIGANRRAAAKLAATPCPSCGKTGLTRARVTLEPATEKHEGHGEVRTTCPHCGHVDAVPFTVPRRDPAKTDKDGKAVASPPATGGKTKGGGGATGEW